MSKKGRIYIPNQNMPRICPDLAKEIGLNESILLLQLDYWLSVSGKKRAGRLWVYESLSDIQNVLSFWSRPTINRIIHSLEGQDLIAVDNFNRRKSDKTRWISLNYETIARLESIRVEGVISSQNETPHDPLFQNETTPLQPEIDPLQSETSLSQNETTLPHDPHVPDLSTDKEAILMQQENFSDLFPGKPAETSEEDDPGILSSGAACDPLSMAAECQRRRDAHGLGEWTVPVDAGGSDTAGDLMLAAWCRMLAVDLSILPDDLRNRYRAKLSKIARTLPSATPAQAARAVAIVLDPGNLEFSWYTYTDPSVAKFSRDWTTVMLRILSGNEPEPSASGLDALDRIIERTT